jgi:hypothetical protein
VAGHVEPFEQAVEVVSGELPFERLRDLLGVASECEQPFFGGGEVAEVVGLEQLALDDREVEFDLDVPIDVKCVCGGVFWCGWCRSVLRRS